MPLMRLPEEFNFPPNIAFWKISESENFFGDQMQLWPDEIQRLNELKVPEKKLQWLASRYLVRLLLNPQEKVVSLNSSIGKPWLQGLEQWQVSYSHSFSFASTLLSNSSTPAIDIEWLDRVIPIEVGAKFLNPTEANWVNAQEDVAFAFLLCWSAKECLYKWIHTPGISFRRDLSLYLPEHANRNSHGSFKAQIQLDSEIQEVCLHYGVLENLLFTYLL